MPRDGHVSRLLDEDAALAREVLAEPRRDAPRLAGEERIAPTVRLLLAQRAAASGASDTAPRARRAWLALAAVLVVCVLVALLSTREQGDGPPIYLGGQIERLAPQGEVAAYEWFRWDDSLPEDGGWTFVVRILDPTHDAAGTGVAPLAESPRLHVAEWRPDLATLALPPRIRWEVWVVDALGQRRLRGFAEAWLRSR